MKVCFVNPEAHTGLAYHDYELIHSLQALGVELTYVTCKDYLLRDQLHTVPGVPRFQGQSRGKALTGLRYIIDILRLPRFVLEHKFDIVHCEALRIPVLDRIVLMRMQRAGIRIVLTVHDVTPLERGMKRMFGYDLLYRQADLIVVYSHTAEQELIQKYGVKSERILLTSHGNYEQFVKYYPPIDQCEARKSLGVPINSQVLLFFGTIRQSKGLDVLLNAMQEVVREVPNAYLLVAGRPRWQEEEKSYLATCDALGLRENVSFRSEFIPDHDVPVYFSAADCLVAPYRVSYQSGVVMLANSYGKAVIASRVGGLQEVVIDEETGLTFKSEDTADLAENILRLLRNPERMAQLGENAFQYSQNEFSWRRTAQMIIPSYDSLLGQL